MEYNSGSNRVSNFKSAEHAAELYDMKSNYHYLLSGMRMSKKINSLLVSKWLTLLYNLLYRRSTEEEKRTFIPLVDYILNVVCSDTNKDVDSGLWFSGVVEETTYLASIVDVIKMAFKWDSMPFAYF